MKELKAYIRPYHLEELISALEAKHAPGITVVEVHPVGYGFEPNYFTETREKLRRAPNIAKLEIVCHDEQVEDLVQTIVAITSTGTSGDGRVFIAPIDDAVRIRDGRRGADIL